MQNLIEITYDKFSSESDENDECSQASGSSSLPASLNSISSQSEMEEEEFFWKLTQDNTNLWIIFRNSQINQELTKILLVWKLPLNSFNFFLATIVLHEVCDMTNKYYQENKNTKKVSKHKKKWVTPDLPTIKCFFGILLFMGIVKNPASKNIGLKIHYLKPQAWKI